MIIPSFVSLKDELDLDLGFADFALSFLLSGEEERLTEMMKKEEKKEKAVPVNESLGEYCISDKGENWTQKRMNYV